MKKKILVEGIIGIYRQRHFDRIEIRLGKTDYNLESIVLQALEGVLPEGYGKNFAGKITVDVELQDTVVKVATDEEAYTELCMEVEK